jgi:hypothetical protein
MWKIVFAMVCLVGLTQLVWSQNEKGVFSGSHSEGIPGFLDPQTRTFTTLVESGIDNPLSGTGSYYYGEIKITLTVYVASAFPSGTAYGCSGTLTVGGDTNGDTYIENAVATAPAPSGGVTTCTLIFNYFWQLTSPTSDIIDVSFTAVAQNTVTVGSQTEIIDLRDATRSNELIKGVSTTQGNITTLTYSTRL